MLHAERQLVIVPVGLVEELHAGVDIAADHQLALRVVTRMDIAELNPFGIIRMTAA